MPVVVLRFSKSHSSAKARPQRCPVCQSTVLQGWGSSERVVQDASELPASIHRYRCGNCGHTFRWYPAGIDQTGYTRRVRRLGAVAWILGLSYREVAAILNENGVDISHTTIWRESRELLKRISAFPERQTIRFAIDREFVRQASPRLGVVVAADFGGGRPHVLGTIDSGDARGVAAWLEILVRDSGLVIDLLRTSRLDSA